LGRARGHTVGREVTCLRTHSVLTATKSAMNPFFAVGIGLGGRGGVGFGRRWLGRGGLRVPSGRFLEATVSDPVGKMFRNPRTAAFFDAVEICAS
jgi:hypothetical protein